MNSVFSCCLWSPLLTFAIFIMSWCRSLWVHLIWDPPCFLYLDICFLLQVWGVFSHNFFKYIFSPLFSFFPFWNPCYLQIGTLQIIPQVGLLHCFHFFFFLIQLSSCCSGWIISIILPSRSLMLSSALFILVFITFTSAFRK